MKGDRPLTALRIKAVSKSFGSLLALDNASATFYPGEIHAVVGENGAGKSTFASVLSGLSVPDTGKAIIETEEGSNTLDLREASTATLIGAGMVHQHFTLVRSFTVAENLALAGMHSLWSGQQVEQWTRRAFQIAEELGWKLKPNQKVAELSLGEQQRLEIIRVLGGAPRLIIFDEPTAVLTPQEVDSLFDLLQKLRHGGAIVVLIAHKLSEVMRVADRVTVLRKGRTVAEAPRDGLQAERLASWMVGEMPVLTSRGTATTTREGVVCKNLVVKGSLGRSAIDGVSFTVRCGEIFGIGGVDGNGQEELAEAMAGVRMISGGEATFQGRSLDRIRRAYIPSDRTRNGLAGSESVLSNLLIGALSDPEVFYKGLLRNGRARAWTRRIVSEYSVAAQSLDQSAGLLSGGNQQKVIVGRSLARLPELLIVSNPTRGLDLRATAVVHAKLLEARDKGVAVLMFSSDVEELGLLCDRIAFLSRGRLTFGGSEAVVGGE